MKDQTTPEQTEFDFNESGETEQQRLEREVLAAGGRVGKSEGRFAFGIDIGEGLRRGDEHPRIKGLLFWSRHRGQGRSVWMSPNGYHFCASAGADNQKRWYRDNKGQRAKTNKNWYDNNKERRAETGRRWRENNKEREAKSRKRWREENREKVAAQHKRYREENPEKCAEAGKRWAKNNMEKVLKKNKRWAKNNPEKVRARNARRRARKLEAFDPSANQAVIDSRYAAEEYLNTVTGCDWHVDHTQPISRGGKDHENNMQVVPAKWNCSKGNHHCDRWIEDSDIYRYATAVEARFEREAKKNEKK